MKQALADVILEELKKLQESILHEGIPKPVDYISAVSFMASVELNREIEFLKEALRDPVRFDDQFKARCAERELNIETNFNFQYSPDSPTNLLYWNLAKKVFEPDSMKAILSILLPGITCQLKADIQYTISTGGIPRAVPVLIADTELAALAVMEPDHERFIQFSISEDIIFDVQNIALFSLKLQSQFYTLLSSEYPKFVRSLYQHNSSLITLSDNILDLNNKGKTPKQALEELMQGFTLAGERMTKEKYASDEINATLALFFNYFKSLDSDLQTQLRAMEGDDDRVTLGKVIDCEIGKGTCVETAAIHLHSILKNNSHNPVLISSPGMSAAALKELNSQYGPKQALDTQKDKRNVQALPPQLYQKIVTQIEVSSIDDLLSFMLNIPADFYDIFWGNVSIDKPEKRIDSLIAVIRQGCLDLKQKQALADALVKHFSRFETETPLLFLATLSDDLDFFQRIISHYTQQELEDGLQEIVNDDTIFLYSVYSPAILGYLLEIYPESKRQEAIKAQDINEKTILHYLDRPALIVRVLNYVPESERLVLLTTQNYKGETVLYRNVKYPAALQAQFGSLSKEDKIKALFAENDSGKMVLEKLIKHPDVFEVILESFSVEEILELCDEKLLWLYIVGNPEAITVLFKLIPDEQARQLSYSLVEDFPEVFKAYFKSLPKDNRLQVVLAKKGDENFLHYAARTNLYLLKAIFKYLSKLDLVLAIFDKDQDSIQDHNIPAKTLLFKIANVPEILEKIFDRLHKKAYFLATLEDTDGKILLDYIVQDRDLCEEVFESLSEKEEFKVITFVTKNGEMFLFNALKNLESFEVLLECMSVNAFYKALAVVDANNENLLQKAVNDKNAKFFEVLMKYLPDSKLRILQNTKAHDGNTLLFHCLENLELLDITSRNMPKSLLKYLLTSTEDNRSLKLHDLASRPEAIKIIFANLTEQGRSDALNAKNPKGQNLAHLAAGNPLLLKAISPWLPANSDVLKIKDNFGNTPLHHFMFAPQADNVDPGDNLPGKSVLLVQIYQSVEKAFSYYMNHHDNRQEQKFQRGFEAGFFSALRHGETGKISARNFRKTILDTTSATEAIDEINRLFINSKAYHTHSFTSYVFDGINDILGQHKLEPVKADKNGHYSKEHWLQAKALLDGIGGEVPDIGMAI